MSTERLASPPLALPAHPAQLPLLTLAYVGDAVFELWVRCTFLQQGTVKCGQLHKRTVAAVCARSQARLARKVEPLLSGEELDIFRRGRNAKSGHQPPHVAVTDYRRATGVEALVGYWYLQGETARLTWLFDQLWEVEEDGG